MKASTPRNLCPSASESTQGQLTRCQAASFTAKRRAGFFEIRCSQLLSAFVRGLYRDPVTEGAEPETAFTHVLLAGTIGGCSDAVQSQSASEGHSN
jgi:hypothetical protein